MKKEWKDMTQAERKDDLVRKIQTDIFDIHSNTCFLLNFCGLTQKEATKLSEHYNALKDIIDCYSRKKFKTYIDKDTGIEKLKAIKTKNDK